MIVRIATFCVLTLIAQASNAQPDQQVQAGYSLELLSQPIFGPAEVAIETARLNNWLNENYEAMRPEQYKGPREYLFYLIDSHVKNIYARDGKLLPTEPDLILQTLYAWAERLGVYGGSMVFNEVRLPSEPEMALMLEPPASIAISMNGDLLRIESPPHWGFDVPYYFMPFIVTEFTANNGMPTQFLAISTGASKDNSEAGRSQATLMLIYSQDVDFSEFEEFWTDQIGIPENAQDSELGYARLTAKYWLDDSTKIHTEALIWSRGSGSFAMTYGGVDGTYQWNRQHFLDFLRSLHQSQ